MAEKIKDIDDAEIEDMIKQALGMIEEQNKILQKHESLLKYYTKRKENSIIREVLFEKYESGVLFSKILSEYTRNRAILLAGGYNFVTRRVSNSSLI